MAMAFAMFVAADEGAAQTFRDCDICPVMAALPSGEFEMGAGTMMTPYGIAESVIERSRPVRRVSLQKPFAMSVTEVTLLQYAVFAETLDSTPQGPCLSVDSDGSRAFIETATWRTPGIKQSENHPVVCVAYAEAIGYVQWLSDLTDQTYRLPSEAEWEYGARAGSTGLWYWGNDASQACKYANVPNAMNKTETNAGPMRFDCMDGYMETAPVRSFLPNSFGLHDMIGNVWEWTEDCWHPNYDGVPIDGSPRVDGADCSIRVVRGGSWGASQSPPTIATRSADPVTYRGIGLGFRVVRDPP